MCQRNIFSPSPLFLSDAAHTLSETENHFQHECYNVITPAIVLLYCLQGIAR